MLNQRNAVVPPQMTPQNAARINRPFAYAMAPRLKKAIIIRPPARPSRPSVMLTEFAEARIMKMKSGMYHQPRKKSPTPGMWIWSMPSFA